MSWSTAFADPVPLPGGRKLLTLKDAADYIAKLPKSEPDLPEWQAAIAALLVGCRGCDTMLARIGVMKALSRHVVRCSTRSQRYPLGQTELRGTNERFYLRRHEQAGRDPSTSRPSPTRTRASLV
jgi:hypothetical protein